MRKYTRSIQRIFQMKKKNSNNNAENYRLKNVSTKVTSTLSIHTILYPTVEEDSVEFLITFLRKKTSEIDFRIRFLVKFHCFVK